MLRNKLKNTKTSSPGYESAVVKLQATTGLFFSVLSLSIIKIFSTKFADGNAWQGDCKIQHQNML